MGVQDEIGTFSCHVFNEDLQKQSNHYAISREPPREDRLGDGQLLGDVAFPTKERNDQNAANDQHGDNEGRVPVIHDSSLLKTSYQSQNTEPDGNNTDDVNPCEVLTGEHLLEGMIGIIGFAMVGETVWKTDEENEQCRHGCRDVEQEDPSPVRGLADCTSDDGPGDEGDGIDKGDKCSYSRILGLGYEFKPNDIAYGKTATTAYALEGSENYAGAGQPHELVWVVGLATYSCVRV